MTASEQPRVFIDANVLWGGLTSDIVLQLARGRLLQPRWSIAVLDEVRRTTARDGRRDVDGIERRLLAMDRAFPRAATSSWEHLAATMPADPGDRHVLAGATASGSHFLLTENDKHFWPERAGLPVQVLRLGELTRALLQSDSETVLTGMRLMVGRHHSPPRTLTELVERCGEIGALRDFGVALNDTLPPHERSQDPRLRRRLPELSPAAQALAGWRRPQTGLPSGRHPGESRAGGLPAPPDRRPGGRRPGIGR